MRKWLHHIGIITSRIVKAVTNSNAGIFCQPVLSDTRHVEGCKLGIDSLEDTCCAGKHAFAEEFIEGKLLHLRDLHHPYGQYQIFLLYMSFTLMVLLM